MTGKPEKEEGAMTLYDTSLTAGSPPREQTKTEV